MIAESIQPMPCPSAPNTPSPRRRSSHTKAPVSDEANLEAQRSECSWSHKSPWGQAAALRFIQFGQHLGDHLYHDDVVADFGGNDGYAAHEFYMVHKIKPIVVECDPLKVDYAMKVYRMPTCESLIEKMPLLDKYVDWGYASHVVEHFRDTGAGLREMARVVRRGCFFILPLESRRSATKNHAHYFSTRRIKDWINILETNGWRVLRKAGRVPELHILAEPR